MLSTFQIRTLFLYEYNLGHKAPLAVKNINDAFKDVAVNERNVQRWFAKFRSGDFSLENEARGKPKTVIDDNVLKALVESDPTITVRDIAQVMGVCAMTVSRHLSLIGKVKQLDKWVQDHELKVKGKGRDGEVEAIKSVSEKAYISSGGEASTVKRGKSGSAALKKTPVIGKGRGRPPKKTAEKKISTWKKTLKMEKKDSSCDVDLT